MFSLSSVQSHALQELEVEIKCSIWCVGLCMLRRRRCCAAACTPLQPAAAPAAAMRRRGGATVTGTYRHTAPLTPAAARKHVFQALCAHRVTEISKSHVGAGLFSRPSVAFSSVMFFHSGFSVVCTAIHSPVVTLAAFLSLSARKTAKRCVFTRRSD